MSRRSGRSSGLISLWAEAQRQREAQERARVRLEREEERRLRAAERERARDQRERQAAYRRQREADARRRTEELDARVEALRSLLVDGCRVAAFGPRALTRSERVEPFDPGALARPVPMPDQRHYQPQDGRRFGAGRRVREEARERYERDRRAAEAAEAERLRRLDAYHRQYERWAAQRLAELRRHNEGVAELAAEVRAGDPDAVVEYFTAALYHSTYTSAVWPEGLPREASAAYDPAARQLVLDWELPRYEIVPAIKSVRYMPGADEDRETARPATRRRALYRDVLAQVVLLALRDLFAADEAGALESVALNGFVDDHDPATGRRARIVLATVTVSRTDFAELRLEQVSAVDCLVDGVRGRLSARPDQLVAVTPGRTPDDVGSPVLTQGGGEEPDLLAMDPFRFESLVADLFRAMGMRAVTTRRSNDGGVDVEAVDPTPIRGGRIVVQVKRYRGTVPPTAVRDLYGTVQGSGANKGVLVTTSRFGPGSHTFAHGKPLELVSGAELVDLLHRHGLRGRLGDGAAAAGAGAAASRAGADAAPPGHNVLGMSWSGEVALDVCALVCDGGRVLSDDHFVFFNNPRTPDGTVSALPATAPDRAAVRVAFDALPPEADRLVLAAAVDPEVDPGADLSGFADARIRLLDASGAELGRLEVSDGRPGETALVLGSFRRRAGGDWDFVVGGKGYPGGLEALVREYGIDVA
ncbi:restriction endonuclease [Streptomyces sp. NBRC 110028]|uniref:restriction endonuclease n=1 Tax=Streptomyces sp. NBRC 110028 TaxID=1621260 RepID=UPI0006E2308E|nr:restriction endonuclease [Streptomyces sp. NBRC 110028]